MLLEIFSFFETINETVMNLITLYSKYCLKLITAHNQSIIKYA